jgi:hypothetical protein
MTIETPVVFDLTDVRAVRFECQACGACTVIKLSEWKFPYEDCLVCKQPWVTQKTPEFVSLNQFANSLRGTIAALDKIKCRVRFEMSSPGKSEMGERR